MKIYLLNPPFLPNFVRCGRWQGVTARGGTLDYPKWLAYTTGLLEKSGNIVKLRDAIASKYLLSDVIFEIKEFSPDIIVVESNFSSLKNDIQVIKSIKAELNKEILSILTGPPTAVYPEKILSYDCIDIIARYEYDFVVNDVVNCLKKQRDLGQTRGIWFKTNGEIIKNQDREFSTQEELDALPFVSKIYNEHLNIRDYYLSQSLYPEVQIFSGRGCPFKCSFCSWPENLMGRKVRVRSIENVVREFEFVKKELHFVKEIFIEDDTFTLNHERIRLFCEELINKHIQITWSCNARADLDFRTLNLMKKAGCRLLIVGYESGSDDILKNIDKGITIEKARKFTKDAKKAGLLIHGDFIIGLPGENENTARETQAFINEIEPDILQIAIATPIPGTQFFNFAKENKFLLVDDMEESIDHKGYQKCIVTYPNFTNENINSWVNKLLKKYYLNPKYGLTFLRGFSRGGITYVICTLKAAKEFLKYIHEMKVENG